MGNTVFKKTVKHVVRSRFWVQQNETQDDEAALARKIDQIRNHIELQKIRTVNASYVDFEVKGEVGNQKIVPMIFLPFIENAFKFSKNKFMEHAIDIRFEVAKDSVRMYCKNYYERHRIKILDNLIPISDSYKEGFYSLIGIKGDN